MKTRALVLFQGFQYFELQNICKRIPNHVRIPLYTDVVVSSFIDNGAGLVRFSSSI